MVNELTSEQIEGLHQRHLVLTAEIRLGVERLVVINETIRTGQVPAGTQFKDIGTPIRERPV